MEKDGVMNLMLRHKRFFRVAVAFFNKLAFNNSLGGGTNIGLSVLRKCKIRNSGQNNKIIVGDFSRLIGCTINISGDNNTICIGDRCLCNNATFVIEDSNNSICIGENTALCGTIELAVIEGTSIEIGQNCLFSSKIGVRTGDSHSLIQKGTKNRLNQSASIIIGNHVWIGTGVTILKGTSIAENCMVGAASLLLKKYTNPNCVIAGVPAKEVKHDIDWMTERI